MTDTERLDWIERTGASVDTNLRSDPNRAWAVQWVHPGTNVLDAKIRPSLREAIDAAMESMATPTEAT